MPGEAVGQGGTTCPPLPSGAKPRRPAVSWPYFSLHINSSPQRPRAARVPEPAELKSD